MKKRRIFSDNRSRWRMPIIAISIFVVVLFLASSAQPAEAGTGVAVPYNHNQGQEHGQNDMRILSGNIPYMMQNSTFSSDLELIGPAPGNANMTLTLYLGLKNMEFLHWYVDQVNNPNSALFHNYMSPGQFRTLFYPPYPYIRTIENYYSQAGFRVWNYQYAPTVIVLGGNVSLVESTFHVREYLYKFTPNGAVFMTNTANPSVPSEFSDIFHVYGLSYSSEALLVSGTSLGVKSNAFIEGQAPSPEGNSYTLTPPNLYSFYQVNKLFENGFSGKGTSIGILGVGQSVDMSAVSTFWNEYGIHNPATKFINLTSNGKNPYRQGFEADLDVEWSGALAPNATIYDVMQPLDLPLPQP